MAETTLQAFLLKLNKNLNILKEREAKYATAAPLDLLNQIDDYENAITMTQQAIEQDIPLDDLQAQFSGLNLHIEAVVFVAQEPPRRPFTGQNPYRGLRKFTEDDAEFFFGRTTATQSLLDTVQRLVNTETSPQTPDLVAVLGASGSGKSSLVRAGLIPALRAGRVAGSEQWPVKVMLPGPRPLEALAGALVGQVNRGLAAIRAELDGGEKALHYLLVESLANQPDQTLFVLVIDQFEELFTLCEDEAERQAFIAQLLHAAQVSRNRGFIILTMRADFYARAANYNNLADTITRHQLLVSPLTEKELREAILLPAEAVGLELEKDLAQALVDDTLEAPGALPLLQHALLELFHRRDGHLLTMAAYREIGGIKGALAHRADGLLAGLTPEQQQMTRRIFLRLIRPGEGTADTRRRAAFEEVVTEAGQTAEMETLVQTLANANLLITDRQPETKQVVLDVSHEALIREWPTLRRWLDEDRQGLRIRQQLSRAAQEWHERNMDASCLYRGARLLEIEEWVAANPGEINQLEQVFVATSVDAREQEKAEKEAQRQRELEQAQALAETQRRRAEEQAKASRRLRRFMIGLAGLLLVALVAMYFAFAQSRLATARKLVADSQLALNESKTHLATLLALEAQRLNEEVGTRMVGQIPYHHHYVQGDVLSGHSNWVRSVAWHPDGQRLASGSYDGMIHIIPEVFISQHPCQWLVGGNLGLQQWQKYRGLALYRATCPNLATPELSFPNSLDDFNSPAPFTPSDAFYYFVLTLPSRLLIIGALIIILGVLGPILWGIFRLVRGGFGKWRQHRSQLPGSSELPGS